MTTREERLDVLLAMAQELGGASKEMALAEHAHLAAGSGSPRRRAAARMREARTRLLQLQSRIERLRAAFLADLARGDAVRFPPSKP